jgi:asparagine synthetase B (glutamine-hydrolysing)
MCGFLWYLNLFPSELFEKNKNSIKQRGETHFSHLIQREKYFYTHFCTDSEESISPFSEENFVLYNGLITNIEDILSKHGLHYEKSISDSQWLKELLLMQGTQVSRHLRGMFSFVYRTDEHIFLVRDTIGIKPLYYVLTENYFWFSSEAKWLIDTGKTIIHEVLPGEIITFTKRVFPLLVG